MEIRAELTGVVWQVLVSIGEEIAGNQDVVILESMKMEIPIESERGGKVKEIKVQEGDFVNEGDVLVVVD
ncbi:acetyl-CoA carboxylase biotin carboxyl carrier protein subunit [Oceanobacillus caeni]|uniref:acetyl-CoA carboxylase biotin carboxyl carrier protein subunit n=1 Tax=Oceanobacillus caeni TaxID=405946 RepID=UPI00214A220F|nr:acetyl-CoA carboxylase biotin carboxyl carrier protein subunit [Oceanobacillus caeni]MCR1832931.1 acetyl-CoA carboxylase biotin carboxyl carrier protein subunit [Oceanobacillus caeni]